MFRGHSQPNHKTPTTTRNNTQVGTILNGVLSFMLESTPTVGSIEKSLSERQALARASHGFNRKTAIFRELFPDLARPARDRGAECALLPQLAKAGGWRLRPWR